MTSMRDYFHSIFSARKTAGFTLIQAAVILAVAAVGAASALTLYSSQVKIERLATTKDRLYDIKAAMARYQATHDGHLPCPAPVDVAPSDTAFGKSDTANCSTAPVQAGTTRVDGTGGNKVRIGAIPVIELGLPADHAADKWGNRFVYAVSEKMADAAVPYSDNDGAITLLGDGATVLGSVPNKTPFVVLSPGQSGAGAVTLDGKPSPVPCPASGPEADNCNNTDATFRAGSFSSTDNAIVRFDDIVMNTLPSDDKAAACGDLGMLYGAKHPLRTGNGCVPTVIQDPATGNVGIGAPATSGAHLEIQGEMKLGDATLSCGVATAGSLRYNVGTQVPEICNGTAWGTLIGNQGPAGPKGATGPAGVKGDTGLIGDKGPTGDPAAAVCPDGICSGAETIITCPADCTPPADPCIATPCGAGCPDAIACGLCGNPACPPGTCPYPPDGSPMPDGSSYTAYSAATVPCGSTCASISETRTCSGGAFSGSYTFTSCTVNACGCTPADPATETRAYGSCPVGTSGGTETRTSTCPGPTWSAFVYNNNCLADCVGTPWGTMISGASNIAYLNSQGNCINGNCPQETRTCTNGTLSGSYTNISCNAISMCSCCPADVIPSCASQPIPGQCPDMSVCCF